MSYQNDRDNSITWARETLGLPNVVILDTETTGLGPKAEPVQIGILASSGGVLLDALIKPSFPIPPARLASTALERIKSSSP